MSELKMREALECIVERFSPIESTFAFSRRMAIKKCREALSQREAHPVVARVGVGEYVVAMSDGSDLPAGEIKVTAKREAQEPVAEIRTEDVGHPYNAMRVAVHFFSEVPPVGTKFYTAPPSREVPVEWVEVMRGLVECARDELVRCEGMKCREPNCISCNDEQEALSSIERSREFTSRARALLASKGGL